MSNHQCAFTIGERRCRSFGVASHPIKPDTGKTAWYCMTHLRDRRGGQEGLALMDKVDRDFDEKMTLRRIDPREANDVLIDNWIAKHPDVIRRPADDKWSHVYRCVQAMPKSQFRDAFLKNLAAKAESVYREIESRQESLT